MAEPTAVEGLGIRIFYSTAALTYVGTTAWTEIEGIRDVTPPTTGKVDKKELTTHASALATHRKQFGPTLIEGEGWSFKQIYDKTVYAALSALIRSKKGFMVMFSDGATYKADGWLEEGKIGAPIDDFMEVEWSVAISGLEAFSTTS